MGPFFIIFGTRGVTYRAGEAGTFHCPSCGQRPYKHKRVRRFFTLSFIPLIPLDKLGEYVECGGCGGTYRPEVLSFNPGEQNAEFEAEFQRGIKRTMVLMALADGVVDPEEVETIRNVYGRIADREISAANVEAEITEARLDSRGVEDYLKGLVGTLNNSGKELVVKAAFMVAAADGEFQDEERELMTRIGKALEMSNGRVNAVIEELTEDAPN